MRKIETITSAAALAVSALIGFGPLAALFRRLIPWWIYGRRAAEQQITLVQSGGRSLCFSNGDIVRDDALGGLFLIWFVVSAIVAVVLLSTANAICRRTSPAP